jgi:hypothetical protein
VIISRFRLDNWFGFGAHFEFPAATRPAQHLCTTLIARERKPQI